MIWPLAARANCDCGCHSPDGPSHPGQVCCKVQHFLVEPLEQIRERRLSMHFDTVDEPVAYVCRTTGVLVSRKNNYPDVHLDECDLDWPRTA